MNIANHPPVPMEPPIRFVASRLPMFLELGRLENYFRRLIYSAVLSGRRPVLNSAIAILDNMEAIFQILSREADSIAAQVTLHALKSATVHDFESEAWAEQFEEAFHQSGHGQTSVELFAPGQDRRQAVWDKLHHVAFSAVEELDQSVRKLIRDGCEGHAFQLGLHLDAAIRPHPTFSNLLADLGPDPEDATPRFDGFGRRIVPRDCNIVFEPSETPFPVDAWLRTLRSIWSALGLSDSCVREREFLLSLDRPSVIGQLIKVARAELERRGTFLTASPATADEGRENLTAGVGTTQSNGGYDLANPPETSHEATIPATTPVDAESIAEKSAIPTDPASNPPPKAAELRHYPTEKRDAFIYNLVIEGEKQYSEIIAVLKAKIKEGTAWENIESENGIKKAAMRYATRKNLPKPPRRKGGQGSEVDSGSVR